MKKNIFTGISFIFLAVGIQGVYPLGFFISWTLIMIGTIILYIIAHVDNDLRLRYIILILLFAQLTNLMRTHCMSIQILHPNSLTHDMCYAFIVNIGG